MPGSTFQPPIHLDPNQDPSQQTAFINQNFQSLASALETNSFRVVSSGDISIPAPSPASLVVGAGKFGQAFGQTIIAHGLPFTPLIFGTLGSSTGGLLPFTAYGPVGVSGGTIFWDYVSINSDSTNIYLSHWFIAFGGTAGNTFTTTGFTGTIRYLLIQQSAS